MILLINVCKEKLHYFEFVRPIEDILKNLKINFLTEHYSKINLEFVEKFEKVIICGTSLKDNDFLDNLEKFQWVKIFDKPILGICAGMQIISFLFDAKIKSKKEIGFSEVNFKKIFLGYEGKMEVYHLHNQYATKPKKFQEFTQSKIPQAIKHETKEIYGVLFHPEVRNKKLIENFCRI